jgi:hypothetical protein
MARERDDWGYYVRAIRDLTDPPSWRWRIIRRGNPMGVLLEAGGFSSYQAARFAGNAALAEFLERLEREKLRERPVMGGFLFGGDNPGLAPLRHAERSDDVGSPG